MIRHLLIALLALFATPALAQDQGRFVEIAGVAGEGLPPSAITVWLPPGYDQAKTRYAVVYMHDAQNLFFPERSNFNKVWAADKSALRLIAARKTPPFIIVGISQPGEARYGQYLPQALYEASSPPLRATFDALAKRPIYSDAYLRFIVTQLKPMIDARFRTRTGRMSTAIVGSSMGGLISCYAFTRYPQVFGRAGCVSTHWPMGDPTKTAPYQDEIIQLWRTEFTRGLGKPAGRRLWMDHGTATLDAFYGPYQQRIDPIILGAGWRKGRDFESRVYEGAPHEENAWAARLDDIFGWLMR